MGLNNVKLRFKARCCEQSEVGIENDVVNRIKIMIPQRYQHSVVKGLEEY